MSVEHTESDVIKSDDNLDHNMTDRSDVNRLEQIKLDAVPSGVDNHNCNSKQTGNVVDGGVRDRKKKTRRGKPKRKKPYNKEVTVSRIKNYAKSRSNNCSRFRNRHPVAPNNTNEFLMEDHKDLQMQELDERLQSTAKSSEVNSGTVGNQNRPPRVRDSSFTSADSDEEYFYSSPEDEEEFLTKEFSNTYKDLHAESLQNMSKPELIQHILQLETRIDLLEQRLGSQNKSQIKEDIICDGEKRILDKAKSFSEYEKELEKWKVMNDKLVAENMMLKRQIRSSSVSTVDSESDSSSSSNSSASSVSGSDDCIVMNFADDNESSLTCQNNVKLGPQGVCSMESEDVT